MAQAFSSLLALLSKTPTLPASPVRLPTPATALPEPRVTDAADPSAYRPDGSVKTRGFLGAIPVGDGVATEYSIGITDNGREVDIPTLVPTLQPDQLRRLLQSIETGGPLDDDVVQAAVDFYQQRKAAQLPAFAGPFEADTTRYPTVPRVPTIGPNYPRD